MQDYRLKVSEATLVRRSITQALLLCEENIIYDPDLARVYRQCAYDNAVSYDQFDFFCFALEFLDLAVLNRSAMTKVLDSLGADWSVKKPDIVPSGPEVGTLAHTAQMMAGIFPDQDWDQWKDDMKDRDL